MSYIPKPFTVKPSGLIIRIEDRALVFSDKEADIFDFASKKAPGQDVAAFLSVLTAELDQPITNNGFLFVKTFDVSKYLADL